MIENNLNGIPTKQVMVQICLETLVTQALPELIELYHDRFDNTIGEVVQAAIRAVILSPMMPNSFFTSHDMLSRLPVRDIDIANYNDEYNTNWRAFYHAIVPYIQKVVNQENKVINNIQWADNIGSAMVLNVELMRIVNDGN